MVEVDDWAFRRNHRYGTIVWVLKLMPEARLDKWGISDAQVCQTGRVEPIILTCLRSSGEFWLKLIPTQIATAPRTKSMMKFDVFGGFDVPQENGTLKWDVKTKNEFWKEVDEVTKLSLSEACGCYIFALKNGENFLPWYVGKAEKMPFSRACFKPTNQVILLKLLARRGCPKLFLIPRMTDPGGKLTEPGKNGVPDVSHLEPLLIALAVARNPDGYNVQFTKMHKQMRVPGVFNSLPGPLKPPARDLQLTLFGSEKQRKTN
ncbi:MAG: hypothetical protein WCF20_07060 [Methylovirgula sp.]